MYGLNIKNLLSYLENSQATTAKMLIMKQKSLNQFTPLYPRFLHEDLLYLIETLLSVF